jgi:ABC-type uncharacterized transport system involved in gliding motility auxiliary subunit
MQQKSETDKGKAGRLDLGWLTDMRNRAVARAGRLDRRTLAWGGLGLGAIILLGVNVIAGIGLKHWKADLTSERLFTISDGTRKVLSGIDEPIDVKLYYSKALGEASPQYQKYFERVRALLEQYRDISRGRLQVELIDPEPFSDAEDRAVAAGLKGLRINREGDTAYFGLAAANSTDNAGVIEFFQPERERFLEYDLSKMIHGLAKPKKRIIGLMAGLPVDGTFSPQGGMVPPWAIMEQVRELFEVKDVQPDVKQIASDIDVLMLVQPDRLTDDTLYAIDQFALRGGRILAFIDPNAENAGRNPMQMMLAGSKTSPLDKLLKAWGVAFDNSKAAADIGTARRVQFGGGRSPTVTEYVAWLSMGRANLDEADVLAGGIERLNFGSPGYLEKVEGATTELVPIIKTSPQAMAIEADKLRPMPDAVALLREYKPGGKPLTIAARVSGETKTAFPDGPPKPAEKKEEGKDAKKDEAKPDEPAKAAPKPADAKAEKPPELPPQVMTGRITAVIVADADMLADQFWIEVRELQGQRIGVPHAHNGAFVLNALENLTGGEVFTRLRGRGIDDRPFELVDRIRRDSERAFREKEQALVAKLKTLQEQLANVETKGDKVVLTDKDRQSIETFRREMIDVRRELRDVKLALRKDIDRLDGVLKLANIAGVPLLVGLGALGLAWMRRRRKAETRALEGGEA